MITEEEQKILERIRQAGDYASIKVEKQAGKVKRIVVEESYLVVVA